MVAEALDRRDEGHSNESSGNTPDPPPEDQAHENSKRIQRESPAENERRYQLRLNDVHTEVGYRNEQCMPDLLEGNQTCQGQQSDQSRGAQIGNEFRQGGHGAPEHGVRHLEQEHDEGNSETEGEVDQRHGDQVGGDRGLGFPSDGNGLLLVAKLGQNLDQLLQKQVACSEQKVEEDDYLERAGNQGLGSAEQSLGE